MEIIYVLRTKITLLGQRGVRLVKRGEEDLISRDLKNNKKIHYDTQRINRHELNFAVHSDNYGWER